jgi:biopolymer transport protein ExbB
MCAPFYVSAILLQQPGTWDLQSMWASMSTLPRVVVGILFVLSIYSFGVMIDRALMYSAARKQSRIFVQQVAGALKDGKLDEAIAIAERNKKSHIAKVVATGLSEFQSASQQVSESDVVEAAKRGLERSVAIVHAEMKRGLSALATIGSTAPFVGLFGTVVGILNAFKGIETSKATGLSAVAGGIAEALVTTALGLLVAVPAVWAYNYFTNRVEAFDVEMDNSSMELINYFTLRQRHLACATSSILRCSSFIDHDEPGRAQFAVRGLPGDPTVPEPPPVPPAPLPESIIAQRYLVARTSGTLQVGVPFQLMARISPDDLFSASGQGSSAVFGDVTGKLKLSIYAPGFSFDGLMQCEIDVPATGNSSWALFELKPRRDGVQQIEVLAWKNSVQVGGVTISVSVGSALPSEQTVQSPIAMRQPEQGEYTLEIAFDNFVNRYRFQLRGDTGDLPPMYDEKEGRKDAAYLAVISNLNAQARNVNSLTEFAQGEWLKGMGGTLYKKLIPADLKVALWNNRDSIKYLNILSATEPMPWELLFISDPAGTGAGRFIADATTVTRWRYGPRAPTQFSTKNSYFVLPNGSPTKAQDEVTYARKKIGTGQTVGEMDDLLKLLAAGRFSLLHFASHNVAPPTGTGGLYIPFGSSKFDITFMGAWSINQFSNQHPLVFMNSCTSGGAAPLYAEMAGWADSFLGAGCGAFIGSLWEIRDTSAFVFAQKFYDEVSGGKSLGESMRAARSALKTSDPTYLAYTLYGNPLARFS